MWFYGRGVTMKMLNLSISLLRCFHQIYLGTGLYNTGTFRGIAQAPALIEEALQLVNGMEELQQLHRRKISGQAQYGSLSSVCRGATKLLAKS